MKIFLADAVSTECHRLLVEAGFEVIDRPGLPQAEQLQALAGCSGMVVRSATKVTAAMMDAAPELRVIGRAGSGVDNIDVAAATGRGILVMNTPGENTLSAAEHAFAMLLTLCRNIATADRRMSAGEWSKKGLMGVELVHKTIGVLGMGRIGQAVARRAKAFRMQVLAFDPFLPAEVAEQLGVEMLDLDEILPRADFLTLHAPLTERTRHLLDADALARCKRGVRVINCARGGLLDESALLQAIDAGQVAGAALDVFEQEPLPADHPLRDHPQVILTPHLGASTSEAQEKVAVVIAEQIAAYLNQGAVRNAVNSISVDADTAAKLEPWQRLGHSLGRLQAAFLDEACETIEIECCGDVLSLPLPAITASVLCGFLSSRLNQNVNVVNAAAVAQQHGIRVVEARGTDTDGYAGLLSVRTHCANGGHLLAGSVIGHDKPKLVRIDDYFLETALKSHMLFCRNRDRPGRLAAITAAIAEHGINVANCALGRDRGNDNAMNAFQLDAPLSESGRAGLLQLDAVDWAAEVDFERRVKGL